MTVQAYTRHGHAGRLSKIEHSNHTGISLTGIDMSGRRPLIKGYFAVLRLIADAVMSSACLMRVMTPGGPDVAC